MCVLIKEEGMVSEGLGRRGGSRRRGRGERVAASLRFLSFFAGLPLPRRLLRSQLAMCTIVLLYFHLERTTCSASLQVNNVLLFLICFATDGILYGLFRTATMPSFYFIAGTGTYMV